MRDSSRKTVNIRLGDSLARRLIAETLGNEGYDLAERPEAADIVLGEPEDGPAPGGGIFLPLRLPDPPGRLRLGDILSRVRRARPPDLAGAVVFGPFRLDTAFLLLRKDSGESIALTEKERDILARLYRENGGIVDRRTLLGDVWGYAGTVETHTLETHIYRLRQKIEADPARPVLLRTEDNGYSLAAPSDKAS